MELHLVCKRCGYRWTRRAQGRLPKQCSRCKNFHWNEDVVRPRGRPPKSAETVMAEMGEEVVTESPSVIPVEEIPKEQFVELWPEAKSGHGESCSCTNCLLERGVL